MEKIFVTKKIQLLGKNSLEERLRRVPLRGITENGKKIFPYESAVITLRTLSPSQVQNQLFNAQPRVYKTILERVDKLREMLLAETGEDLFSLKHAFDYEATEREENGFEKKSFWTMLPPVIEENELPVEDGKINYGKKMPGFREELNPVALSHLVSGTDDTRVFPIVCDGMHRVYSAFASGKEITVIWVSKIRKEFPYYAVPQEFSKTTLIPRRENADLPQYRGTEKIHVLRKEREKDLYRLFPEGGIMAGAVRPDTK